MARCVFGVPLIPFVVCVASAQNPPQNDPLEITGKSLMQFRTLAVLLLTALLSVLAFGQNDGVPTFSTIEDHGLDSINLQNLDVLINTPVRDKAGAMPFHYGLVGNSHCDLLPEGSQKAIFCALTPQIVGFGNSRLTVDISPPVYLSATPLYNAEVYCPDGHTLTDKASQWVIQDPDGTSHPLPVNDYVDDVGCLSTSFTDTTTDDSHYTIKATGGIGFGGWPYPYTIYAADGSSTVWDTYWKTPSAFQDTNGNKVSINFSIYPTPITDTLNVIALTGSTTACCYFSTFNWNDINGVQQAVSETYSSLPFSNNFGCSNLYTTTGSSNASTGVSYPDGTISFTYEVNPLNSAYYTGRIHQITYKTGGTVTYAYSGGTNGIDCTYIVPPTMTRTTQDGTWTYTWTLVNNGSGNYGNTTTVLDPGKNKTVYTFTGLNSTGNAPLPTMQALTQVQKYQNTGTVSSPVYTLLTTDVICYNGVSTGCSTAVVSYPIREKDVYHTVAGMSSPSRTQITYDTYGNVTSMAKYNFGSSSYTYKINTTYGSWNGSQCVAIGNYINNRPCDVATTDGTHTLTESRYTYDPHGNLLTKNAWTGSTWLVSSATYNANGTVATSTDVNGTQTTYSYAATGSGGCNGVLLTQAQTIVSSGDTLTTSQAWDSACNGAVPMSATDASGNQTIYGYVNSSGTADPFWRVMSVTDPLGNEAWETYPSGSSPDTTNSSFAFNSGNSIQNVTTTTDGYGRPVNVQKQQGPSLPNYDTVSTAYGWSGTYRTVATSLPCSQQLGSSCGTTHTDYFDLAGRVVQATTSSNETITNAYNENDVLNVLSPAPANENNKQVQTQYDGLGRLQYSCVIGNGSSTACNQNTGTANGVTDSYTYGSGTGYTTVATTRGSQTRTNYYDGLGRMTENITPEGGTWYFYYDSYSSCPTGYKGATGQLTAVKDPNGNLLCYAYDGLNRISGVNASGTTCRHFYYDNSNGYSGSIPSGVSAPLNAYGRVVEAATDSCTSGSLITDEWFSYNKDGNMTDMWEMTPNSGQYYHSAATFYGNGTVKTLSLSSPTLFQSTYSLDGEGRWNQMTTFGQTIVPSQGVTFNAAGQPTLIDIGTVSDNDAYSYDANTGRMKSWMFTVSTQNQSATLNWNPNGTLNNLAITDGFHSGGTQTCYFNPSSGSGMGYDDWGRLLNDNCGSVWTQTFSYDQYDNLTKSGSITWNPGYNSTNNQYTLAGTSYDSNGNLKADTFHNYEWNEFSRMKSVDRSGTNCANGGECLIYDAFGKLVEVDSGSTKTEIWYTQLGKMAYMNGSSYTYSYWPTPGGGTLLHQPGNYYFQHKDWLGNARISSNLGTAIIDDRAFAPYGEMYDNFGSTNANELIFTGDTQDVVAGIYNTPNREYHGPAQGRWISPDPAGAGWNPYAYVSNNPLSFTDPSGLCGYCEERTPHYLIMEARDLSGECGFCDNYTLNGVSVSQSVGLSMIGPGNEFSTPFFQNANATMNAGVQYDYGLVLPDLSSVSSTVDTGDDPFNTMPAADTLAFLGPAVYGVVGETYLGNPFGGDVLMAANNGPQQPQQPQQPQKPQQPQPQQRTTFQTVCGNWGLANIAWGSFNLGTRFFILASGPVAPEVATFNLVSSISNSISGLTKAVVCP